MDDAPEVRSLLQSVLEAEGYATCAAGDGQQGLRAFYAERPVLVIADLVMPHMDGLVMLERIREVSDVPVIILSGRDEEPVKVKGLRHGADDYLVKPMRPSELVARVGAVLRRVKMVPTDERALYHDAVLTMDFSRHEVLLREKRVSLSPQEFRLLGALVRAPGTVLSTERLLDLSWGTSEGGPENVRVYMGYLRRKLERDPKSPQLLETVRGFGYRYNPQRMAAA